jgi:hypothetical protein
LSCCYQQVAYLQHGESNADVNSSSSWLSE